MKKFITILFLSIAVTGCKSAPSVDQKLIVEVSTDDLEGLGGGNRQRHVAAKVKGSGRFELTVKY